MRSKLKHTKQCAACPWILGSSSYRINPQDVLAVPGMDGSQVWPCHHCELDPQYKSKTDTNYIDDFPCIGWLHHQFLDGNSPHLTAQLENCVNYPGLELRGEQRKMWQILVFLSDPSSGLMDAIAPMKVEVGDGSYCPVNLEAAYSLIRKFTQNEVID